MRRNLLYGLLSAVLFQSCAAGDDAWQHDEDPGITGSVSNFTGLSHNAIPVNVDALQQGLSYNIYMDNSFSMNGYFNGKTDFIANVNRLITQLSIYADDERSLCNLYYFNNGIKLYGNTGSIRIDSYLRTVDNFFSKEKNGNRGITELKDILNSIFDSTRSNTVNMIVTDGIASPGLKGQEAATYFDIMENSLYKEVYRRLSRFEFATAIIKCSSDFNGIYINQNNKGVTYTGKTRPYYVILTGNEKAVNGLARMIQSSPSFRGVDACYTLGNTHGLKVRSKVLLSPDYQLVGKASDLSIRVANPEGNLRLRLLADMRDIPVSEDYLMDPANYIVSPASARLVVAKVTDQHDPANKGYTHKFMLAATNAHSLKDISIRLRYDLPSWVEETNTESDLDITDSSQSNKTLGFLPMVKGIQAGYREKGLIDQYFSLNVTLNNNL